MTAVENVRLDALEEKIEILQSDVKKILIALVGDDLKIEKGLIAEYKDMKERLTKLESLKNKIIWVSVGAGVAAGMSIDKVIDWIQIVR